MKARINFVSKNSPSYVIEMDILEDGAIVERVYIYKLKSLRTPDEGFGG